MEASRDQSSPPTELVASVGHMVVMLCVVAGLILLQFAFIETRWDVSESVQQHVESYHRWFYISTIAMEWVLVFGVWIGLYCRGNRLKDLIGGNWNRWRAVELDGILALGLWICLIALSFGVSFFLFKIGYHGESNQVVKRLLPHGAGEMTLWVVLALSAGFSEELLFRGYFLRQFHALTGSKILALFLQAALFGLGHIYQGVVHSLLITIYGLAFGGLALWRNSLRPGMMGHAWTDLSVVLLALIGKSHG
jgi:hypothetical protein